MENNETAAVPETGAGKSAWRKELKKRAKKTVKKHYLLLLIVLLISVFFATEFTTAGSLFTLSSDMSGTVGAAPDGNVTKSASVPFESKTSTDVFEELVYGSAKKGSAIADRIEKHLKKSEESKVLGRSRGALASVVNTVSSGKLYVKILSAINNIVKNKGNAKVIFIILALLVYLWVWIFLKNVYQIVVRRMFLEARIYDKVPITHGINFIKAKRWGRSAATLLLTYIFWALWALTIIGGIIKLFSYWMVPYIVAENPDVKPREAITLSRKMMDGHKWECFVLWISFIGWIILSALTAGLVELFYYAPYKQATMCEYYARLRTAAKEKGIEGSDKLNDTYLFEKADTAELESTYRDIREKERSMDENAIVLTGARKFCAEYLGIWIGSTENKRIYQDHENERNRIKEGVNAVNRVVYPARLNPLDYQSRKGFSFKFSFLKSYTVWSLMFMFIFFCFLGWCWEVSLHLVQDGVFVNRGSLNGPWLPIYGSGGILILICLSKLRSRPVLELIVAVVLCGFLEYFTSVIMEAANDGMRWWDYTGYFLNLDGRICAEGLIAFGVIGMIVVYLVAPIMDTILMKVKTRVLIPIVVVLFAIFIGDVIYSHFHPNVGEGITDYDAYKKTSVTDLNLLETDRG